MRHHRGQPIHLSHEWCNFHRDHSITDLLGWSSNARGEFWGISLLVVRCLGLQKKWPPISISNAPCFFSSKPPLFLETTRGTPSRRARGTPKGLGRTWALRTFAWSAPATQKPRPAATADQGKHGETRCGEMGWVDGTIFRYFPCITFCWVTVLFWEQLQEFWPLGTQHADRLWLFKTVSQCVSISMCEAMSLSKKSRPRSSDDFAMCFSAGTEKSTSTRAGEMANLMESWWRWWGEGVKETDEWISDSAKFGGFVHCSRWRPRLALNVLQFYPYCFPTYTWLSEDKKG